MQSPDNTAAQRLAAINASIETAHKRFAPLLAVPQLVAVSKTFAADEIVPYLEAGQRVFGENRVQETKDKWTELKARFPDSVLHLIGPLQTNKVKEAVGMFDVIETLDRDRLAEALKAEMERSGKRVKLFIQVNIGLEDQKSGIAPADAPAFIERCKKVHGLEIDGLMCIPPAGMAPGPYFGMLASLAKTNGLFGLSMGMSADYPVAIAMGATHIRVGSALFGHRNIQV